MRLIVDGEERTLQVDLAKGEVRVGGVAVPFRVVDDGGGRVELELDGEKFVLEGWPPTSDLLGAHALIVNREACRIEVAEVEAMSTTPFASSGAKGVAAPGSARGPTSSPPAPAGGPGLAITTPMPGKVLEVRVHDGDPVAAGDTLLVLEAMKMRNEVQSPSVGRVADLSVAPGESVKAKQVLLRVLPT